MIHWHRNLYDGLDATPEVADGSYLLFIDEQRKSPSARSRCRRGPNPLAQSGRPRSDHPASRHRGACASRRELAIAKVDKRVKVFKPITKKIRQNSIET